MDNIGKTNTLNSERKIVLVDDMNKINSERAELLQALQDLYKVRSNPFSDEQKQIKFEVECKIEEILKRYESEE